MENSPLENPDEILRWLARTQNLDGSWPQGIEFTAAALLAFVRFGHTHMRGNYRKQVRRAADWLAQVSAAGTPAYAQALALFELAQVEHDASLPVGSPSYCSTLPAPSGAFRTGGLRPVSNRNPVPLFRHNGSPRLEDIRTAAACHLHLAVPPELISGDPTHLTLIWALSLH